MSASPVPHPRRSPLALARLAASRGALRLKAWRRWRDAAPDDVTLLSPQEPFPFCCNICGTGNEGTLEGLDRERITCSHCGSSVRFRAMVCLVTRETLGAPLALPSLAPRRDIAGLGLSDAWSYAHRLAARFDYVNTFYHASPRLDICDVGPEHTGRYDFVLSSDVFEHVRPPARDAFVHARRMLKAGGKLILTVPFSLHTETVEHYPDLHDWRVDPAGDGWRLTNVRHDGTTETFDDLVFHGGPGSTLEMRVFSRDALLRELLAAGFSRVRVASEAHLPFGIHWPQPTSVPLVAYA